MTQFKRHHCYRAGRGFWPKPKPRDQARDPTSCLPRPSLCRIVPLPSPFPCLKEETEPRRSSGRTITTIKNMKKRGSEPNPTPPHARVFRFIPPHVGFVP
ncbi:hypothetical protein BGZ63DRAFT_122288 [Mariannaea sp. PMI_226]|nr:hypothetical protein BGZ63DRAFT_122288 [Mariannaea sp. PMI_226]